MGTAYNPASWTTFFSAQVSASSALAGLVFVAISINLAQIVKQRQLVARAAKALLGLMGVLLAAMLCLIPALRGPWLGWELTALGGLIWLGTTLAQLRASHRNKFVSAPAKGFYFVLTQAAAMPCLVGGASLVYGRGGGLYWLAGGAIFSMVAALMDSWVLLIEIQR